MATVSDYTQLKSAADIAAASGFGNGKIIGVVESGSLKQYEVGLTDLGSGIQMADGKFANPVGGSLNKSITKKTTANTGELPNWAAWIADTSTSTLTRPMPASPSDGEEVTVRDGGNNAETNNINLTVTPPTTIHEGVLNVNGQSKKFRYDATGDAWDLVFSDAPASGGGVTYEAQSKVLYISDGLVSETDTGAKLSNDRREVVDIATYLGSEWVGEELWIETEVYNDTGNGVAGWGDPEWMYETNGRGVKANQKGYEIVVQSGGIGVIANKSNLVGSPFGLNTTGNITQLKTRVVVTRLTYNNSPTLGNLVDAHYIDVGMVTTDSRYTFDIASEIGLDWVGKDIFTECQISNGADWSDPEFIYTTSGEGVRANMLNGDTIVAQAGSGAVANRYGNSCGSPIADRGANILSAPCRIKCYKFTDAAIANGVVESATFDLGSTSNNTRTVTSISSIGTEFVGKNLITMNQIQLSGNWGNPEWIYASGGIGIRSNVIGSDIVTQSGLIQVTFNSNDTGDPFGGSHANTSAPSRIKVWRLG